MNPLKLIGPRLLTALAVLLLLEFALRHHGGYGWWTVNQQSARYGWTMLPDQTGRSRDLSVEERINSMGFRDREWDPPAPTKDDTLFRVAVVGNSMTFGTSVTIEQTWPRVLERLLTAELAERGDPRRVLVMNFAVQGYVYEQMARVYQDKIAPYRPDLLIVPTHPHDMLPMAQAADDAEYDLRDWVMRTAIHDWIHKRVVNKWIPGVPKSAETRRRIREHVELDAAFSERPFAREYAPLWDDVIRGRPERVTAHGEVEQEALLGLLPLADRVAADGGRLVLLSLPRWRQMFEPELMSTATRWEALARSRDDIAHVDALADFLPPMQPVVDEVRAGTGRRWLDDGAARLLGNRFWLTDDLDSQVWVDADGVERAGGDLLSEDATLFFTDDVGHYSAAGHALLGEVVFRELKAQGLVDG